MNTITLLTPGTTSSSFFGPASFSADWTSVVYGVKDATTGAQQLVFKNLQTGATQTIATAPGTLDDALANYKVSPDGRFVAYSTVAFDGSSHVAANTIYLYDLTTGQTRTVYSDTNPATQAGIEAISPDDQSLFFSGSSTAILKLNLQTGVTQQILDDNDLGGIPMPGGTYSVPYADGSYQLVNLTTGAVTPILSIAEAEASVSVSEDGHFAVITTSDALLPDDTDGNSDLYIKDLSTGDLRLVSSGNADAFGYAWMSDDDSRVIFESDSSGLGASPTDFCIVSEDIASGAMHLLWDLTTGGFADLRVSPDGKTFALMTGGALTAADTNSTADVYLVVPVDDPPVVRPSSGVTTATEHTPAIVDPGVKVTDDDDTTLASATVSISNFALGDVLAFNPDAAIYGNIQASYDSGILSLISQDASATVAQWQEALRSITYNTTSLAPDPTPRQIVFSVNDGVADNVDMSLFKVVEVQRVNDPPTLVAYQGVAFADLGGDDAAFALVVQPNGDAVVVGGSVPPAVGHGVASLARFTPSGDLDQTFGNGGKVLSSIPFTAQNAALEPDGKIVALVSADLGEQEVARFNSDGTLDTSFGGSGVVALPPDDRGGLDVLSQNSLAVQADGKIIVAAQSYNGGYPRYDQPVDVLLLRYNVNGTLDSTFGSGGIVRAPHRTDFPTPSGIAVDADGKIVVSVQTVADGPQYLIERYNSDGTVDTSFGTQGIAASPIQKVQPTGQIFNDVLAPVILSGGKLLVASSAYNADRTSSDIDLVRYNHDGSVDTSFGGTGTVTIDLKQFDEAKGAVVQADGKILVLGTSSRDSSPVSETFVMRFLANGSLDTSFGTGGKATLSSDIFSDPSLLNGLQIGPGGKILVSGTTTHGASNEDFALVRLNADGSLDSTLAGPVYDRSGPPVVLDSNIVVSDPELQAADDYAGATLALARHGGASPDDVFGVSGAASISGGNLIYSGVVVGSATQAGGTLVLTFNDDASQSIVQSIAKSITYSNTSPNSPPSVQIDWTFNDGNSGDQGTGGALSASVTTVVGITGTSQLHVSIDAVASDNIINASETSKNFAVTGASDAIGGTIALAVDGNTLSQVTVGNDGKWSATIDTTQLGEGAHQFRATVSNGGASAQVDDPVTIDTNAPTITTMDFVPGVAGTPVVEIAAFFSEKIDHFSSDLLVVQDSHFHVTMSPYFLDPNHRIIQENLTSDDPARFHTFTFQVNPGTAFDLAGNANAVGGTLTVGAAFDGYIVGGTVRYANGSGNGATATTDAHGNFVLSGGNGPLVMTGGTDISTGLAFTGTFAAPDGASVLSPLTTLMEKLIEASPADTVAQAADAVASALGLPAGIDLTALDAVAGALSGDAASTAAFKLGSEVLDITTLIAAAGGSASDAYAALAADVAAAAGAGTSVDLADMTTIEGIAQTAGLDPTAAQVVASIVSQTDAALEQQLLGATSPLDVFVDITGASIALQGDAASALLHASGDDGYQQVRDSYLQNLSSILSHDDTAAADLIPAPGTVSITGGTVKEGDAGTTILSFTVTRTGGTGAFDVSYATSDGNYVVDFVGPAPAFDATVADNDYIAKSGTLHFADGVNTQTIDIAVVGDIKVEKDEIFYVTLSNPTNGAALAPTTFDDAFNPLDGGAIGTGVIANDDVPLQPAGTISITGGAVTEGDLGTTKVVTFTVTRTGGTGAAFDVSYATFDGGSSKIIADEIGGNPGNFATVANNDYVAKSGTLHFDAGVNTQTIDVTVVGDDTFEKDEVFGVSLSNPTSAAVIADSGDPLLPDGIADGVILNDDQAAGTISISGGSVVEGDAGSTKTLTFTVARTGGTGAFDVSYGTFDGGLPYLAAQEIFNDEEALAGIQLPGEPTPSSIAGKDYVATSGTLHFAKGVNTQTIEVTVIGNGIVEPDKIVGIALSNPTGGAVLADTVIPGNVVTTTSADPTFTATFAPGIADGTIVNDDVACYCPGTLIATERGERAVEQLSIGDHVHTPSGLRPIKWIGTRSYGGRFIMGRRDILPICFKAGSLGEELPRRDLWISPHHAMYLDGVLIEAKDLVNGVSIVQAEEVDRVEYFHIELDSHDVILAEGAWSETFVDDDSRGMFHNANEFAALYPDDLQRPARYCAPRLDCGHEVEAIRHHLALRAGICDARTPDVGALRGYVDHIDAACIAGWAQNVDHPEAPVCLDILSGGRLMAQVLANIYRKDLKQAGIGTGAHGFTFKPPRGMALAGITVRRSVDGAPLPVLAEAMASASRLTEAA